jgi:hypothetical protein
MTAAWVFFLGAVGFIALPFEGSPINNITTREQETQYDLSRDAGKATTKAHHEMTMNVTMTPAKRQDEAELARIIDEWCNHMRKPDEKIELLLEDLRK